MPQQQARGDRGEPILYNPDEGVRVRNGAGVVGPGATHLTVRASRRHAKTLNTLADVAVRDERIETALELYVRYLAETVKNADGPVVIVMRAFLDVAEHVSEIVQEVEHNGITYQSHSVGSNVKSTLRTMKREGFVREQCEATADDIPVRDAGALVRSPQGLLHLTNGDRCMCGNFDPENATETVTEFNGAGLLEAGNLCPSAEKRIITLVGRLTGSKSASRHYAAD